MSSSTPVTFVGHPFSSIGMGESLRSSFSSYDFFDHGGTVYDVHRFAARRDRDHLALFEGREVRELPGGVRIFHVNGDEVAGVLEVLEHRNEDFRGGSNVIVPAWELPEYPQIWVDALRNFDEVWAFSQFVRDGLSRAGVNAHWIGMSAELDRRAYLPRRTFGIRDSAFVFLTFVDLTSFPARKNPQGALELYRRLRDRYPYADMQLVVKAKNGDRGARDYVQSLQAERREDIHFIDQPMSAFETQSLISAGDCFLSLHRAEGFGRGAAEAMWLGRSAIATRWSGNLDYMREYPCAIDYQLVAVGEAEYPHALGQTWAEPDLDHAFAIAERLLTDQAYYREVAKQGQLMVRSRCSRRAIGLRMVERIEALQDASRVSVG